MIQRFDDCIYLHKIDDEGAVLGSCLLSPYIEGVPNGDLWLFKLEVKPEHRRKGVATELIQAAQRVARLRGGVSIYLEPKPYGIDPPKQTDLFRLYKRLGFQWDMQVDSPNQNMAWRPSD